ncbi:MAG: mercuric reductase [Desulfocapsaceae bacterium]|nr:mercuric reductase [Desulfocapsaceae bacterium]
MMADRSGVYGEVLMEDCLQGLASGRRDDDQRLLAQVHPAGWVSPRPASMYNLVVIGAGTAGLISAAACAALGGKVALVERHLMGGDCLNTGCVPSKCLIRSSRAAAEMAGASCFGLRPGQVSPADFPAVMERLRRLRADISHNDSAHRFKAMGVDVFFGSASFADRGTVSVDGVDLHFRRAIIAAGARAVHPEIAGLNAAGFLTSETVFDLTELPGRLAVVGGGPIGCELAQAFARLGSAVTLIQHSRFLPREDAEASDVLARVFRREGIRVLLDARLLTVKKTDAGREITVRTGGQEETIAVDRILIGAGRAPNVEGLGLEKAGVAYDSRRGVLVDDFLRTTNAAVFAAGDICMDWKFTHAADAAARIAVQNALFRGRKRLSRLNMPWCTYTSPEIAHVGLSEAGAEARGMAVDTYRVGLDEVDRALVDGESEGFVKVLVRRGTDRILGATIVGSHAGDLINEISVAMAGKVGLKKLADIIHPYPTQAEAIRRVAAAYNRTRLTPPVAAALKWWLKWQRKG